MRAKCLDVMRICCRILSSANLFDILLQPFAYTFVPHFHYCFLFTPHLRPKKQHPQQKQNIRKVPFTWFRYYSVCSTKMQNKKTPKQVEPLWVISFRHVLPLVLFCNVFTSALHGIFVFSPFIFSFTWENRSFIFHRHFSTYLRMSFPLLFGFFFGKYFTRSEFPRFFPMVFYLWYKVFCISLFNLIIYHSFIWL